MYIMKYFDTRKDVYYISYVCTQNMAEKFKDLMVKLGMKEVSLSVV
jgi:hypothetical protein